MRSRLALFKPQLTAFDPLHAKGSHELTLFFGVEVNVSVYGF